MFHHQLADNTALHFLPSQRIEFLFNLLDGTFNFTLRQRTLLASLANANIEFLSIKGLTPLVALNHHQVGFLDSLIRAESPLALLALSPSMNGITNITRVFDS